MIDLPPPPPALVRPASAPASMLPGAVAAAAQIQSAAANLIYYGAPRFQVSQFWRYVPRFRGHRAARTGRGRQSYRSHRR